MLTYALLFGGLALLVVGGEFLVRGAATTAERLGMPPLLIGIVLVGFGTSAPELVTSVQASLSNASGIALGNIVGSNIANILLILGVAALLSPIAISNLALKRDGVTVVVSALFFIVAGWLLPFDRLLGAILLTLLILYLYYAYHQEAGAGRDMGAVTETAYTGTGHTTDGEQNAGLARLIGPIALAVGGLLIVVLGARLLVDGAISLAREFGISETVIGLTIVSVGTSLPELATTVIAAIRRHSDVALGNVLGSCVYNVLGIGGATALVAPTIIPREILTFDGPVMIAASLLLLVLARTGMRISRLEGGMLLFLYCAYIYWIWPQA